MITNLLTTKYEYKDKSIADRFADFFLTPCRYFLKGRKIAIVERVDPKVIPPGYEEFAHQIPDPIPRNEVDGISDSFAKTEKPFWKTCLAIVGILPGLVIGGISKGLIFLCSSRLRQFRKISSRYECTYSLKKSVQQKLDFQLACAAIDQNKQVKVAPEPLDDKQKANVEELKNSHVSTEGFISGGVAETIGMRKTMEDAHLASESTIMIGGTGYSVRLYGVFDGHGGQQAAQFMKDELENMLISIFKGDQYQDLTPELIPNALTEACVRLDIDFRKKGINCGTTATFSLILDKKIYTVNVGDSRTILATQLDETHEIEKSMQENDASLKGEIIQLTEDAKLDRPRFTKAIEKAGGEIQGGRINGLSCARDIGFTGRCLVSPRPKITCVEEKKNSLLLLACDGFWDVFTTNEAGEKLLNGSGQRQRPVDIAAELLKNALDRGSQDNITVMVVRI